MKPCSNKHEKLRPLRLDFCAPGSCVKGGTIMKATREDHDAVVDIGL